MSLGQYEKLNKGCLISVCETYKTLLPRYQFSYAQGAGSVKGRVVWDKMKGVRDM